MKVMLTGGSGFLGRNIQEFLKDKYGEFLAPRSTECDLLSYQNTLEYLQTHKPDVIIHSAAYYGGLGINLEEPANIFFRNTVMAANLFEAGAKAGISRILPIGSACSYPGHIHGDLKEDDFWSGALHDSVEAYGFSKKIQLVAQNAYKKQYGIESNHLILTNLYGPYDEYGEYRSHVLGALIKRFCDAKKNNLPKVVCWGDGSPIREFLYVKDAARVIVSAIDFDHSLLPVNIGTGIGTTIRELTELIVHYSGYEGEVIWDTNKANGVARKVLDSQRMRSLINEEAIPKVTLKDGVKMTIEWYRQNLME